MKKYKIEFEILAKEGQFFVTEDVLGAMRELFKNFKDIKEAKFMDKNQK